MVGFGWGSLGVGALKVEWGGPWEQCQNGVGNWSLHGVSGIWGEVSLPMMLMLTARLSWVPWLGWVATQL